MKKSLTLATIIILLLVVFVKVFHTHINSNHKYTITTPYEYPITPEDPKWAELDTNPKKIRACRVPDEIIAKMTTEALLETVLNHPLSTNMFVYSSYGVGFNTIKELYGTGLGQLMLRTDLPEAIINVYNKFEISTAAIDEKTEWEEIKTKYSKEIDDTWKMSVLDVIAAKAVSESTDQRTKSNLEEFAKVKNDKKAVNQIIYGSFANTFYKAMEEFNAPQTRNYETYVTTPRGSEVEATYVTVEEYPTQAEKDKVSDKMFILYGIRPIRDATSTYNCHSYAWYSQSLPNPYNVWDVLVYMHDGSYRNVSSQIGAKLYYSVVPHGYYEYDGNDPDQRLDNHSGIITGVNPLTVTSKWGHYGLYNHHYQNCPWYYDEGQTYEDGNPVVNYLSSWILN